MSDGPAAMGRGSDMTSGTAEAKPSRRQALAMGAAAGMAAAAGAPGLVFAQGGAKVLNVVFRSEPALLACGVDTADVTQTVSGGKILQSLVRYDAANQPVGKLASPCGSGARPARCRATRSTSRPRSCASCPAPPKAGMPAIFPSGRPPCSTSPAIWWC
jgi:hypothetical protein